MEIETICEEALDDEVVQHQKNIVRLNEDVVHGDDQNLIEALDTVSDELMLRGSRNSCEKSLSRAFKSRSHEPTPQKTEEKSDGHP